MSKIEKLLNKIIRGTQDGNIEGKGIPGKAGKEYNIKI